MQTYLKRRLIIAGAVMTLVTIFCACGAASTVPSNNSSSSSNSNPKLSATPKTGKVGATLLTSNWKITLKDASIDANPPDGETPSKSGYVFLLLDISAQNISKKTQDISSIGDFKLSDASGQSYDPGIDGNAKASPDGKVNAGSPVAGSLVYEVPDNIKKFTLDFTPDIMDDNDSVSFDFNVK